MSSRDDLAGFWLQASFLMRGAFHPLNAWASSRQRPIPRERRGLLLPRSTTVNHPACDPDIDLSFLVLCETAANFFADAGKPECGSSVFGAGS
jgi:hypothetical protein